MADLNGITPLRAAGSLQRPLAKASAHFPGSPGNELAGKSLPQLIQLADELASEPPPVNYARIAEIRDAISTGNYRLDPNAIAQRILGQGS